MQQNMEHTCEICARPYLGGRKHHFCPHCKTFHAVCPECRTQNVTCPHCGIRLQRKLEPLKKMNRLAGIKPLKGNIPPPKVPTSR